MNTTLPIGSKPSGRHVGLPLAISENAMIFFVCPPKFCIGIVFVFSWDHCKSQGKLETTLMRGFGGRAKRIVVFSAVAFYGIHHVGATSVLKIDNRVLAPTTSTSLARSRSCTRSRKNKGKHTSTKSNKIV